MREISREEHEYLLDLFIMAFMDWHVSNDILINDVWIERNTHQKLKNAFPMDEYCEGIIHQTTTGITIKSQYSHNYIKEV